MQTERESQRKRSKTLELAVTAPYGIKHLCDAEISLIVMVVCTESYLNEAPPKFMEYE